MIVTLEETKVYLRVEGDEDDMLIASLINAAEEYLYNATGQKFDENNKLAKLFCWVLVSDWYENRGHVGQSQTIERVRPIVESMLAQLQQCYGGSEVVE